MRRGAALFVVGSAVLVTVAACGRISFEQREPWRREAELACMRSGAVKSGNAAVPVRAINGPGMCGAEHPFKVSALGDRTLLGYFAERPPAGVPQGFPIPPSRSSAAPYGAPAQPTHAPAQPAAAPLSIRAPGTEADDDEEPEPEPPEVFDQPDSHARAPAAPLPRLGPQRGAAASGPASVSPQATLACPLVATLDRWMAGSVQPAAQRWFGQQVVEIRQISAYSCRGMNGNPRARISEHAFGNALDIAAFTLADGRRVTVKNGWHGSPEEQGFLRDVHAAACQHFSTVLAPGSNRFHYDHIHVDLARRRSGRSYCNPAPVPGELIARRAADRMATGSIGTRGALGFAPESNRARGARRPLEHATPGAD